VETATVPMADGLTASGSAGNGQKRKENGMDGLIEMLWTLTLIGMFFLVPIATLALIGKIFGIKELTDAFKF